MSTRLIHEAVVAAVTAATHSMPRPLAVLDIGAGRGELLALLSQTTSIAAKACDYHVDRFALEDIDIVRVDVNREPLPYADQSFDVVCCSEVIEHVENFRELLRQAHRVLKPGGVLVVTTPNVLNLKSRVRYLVCGFPSLFGPLPVKNENRASTGGHITPIPYFYLAHALLDADFVDIELTTDKHQSTSRALNFVLAPLLALGWKRFMRRESRVFQTIDATNEVHVRQHRSRELILGRTVVCSARRPRLATAS